MLKNALCFVLCAALLGCASRPDTTLEVTWASPQLPKEPFKKLLIITVAYNEFAQTAVQNQLAAELQKRGVNAVASHRYFTRYTDAEKERFRRSIEASDADFVMVARVTNTAEKDFEGRGMIVGPTGMPVADAGSLYGSFSRYAYPTSYVAGADGSQQTVTTEASIYARKDEKMIWSARTRTTNAQVTTGEGIAPQYVQVILEAMKKDKLIR